MLGRDVTQHAWRQYCQPLMHATLVPWPYKRDAPPWEVLRTAVPCACLQGSAWTKRQLLSCMSTAVTGTSCCWERPDATVSIRLLHDCASGVARSAHGRDAFVRSLLRALPNEGATTPWPCCVASPALANPLTAVVCAICPLRRCAASCCPLHYLATDARHPPAS